MQERTRGRKKGKREERRGGGQASKVERKKKEHWLGGREDGRKKGRWKKKENVVSRKECKMTKSKGGMKVNRKAGEGKGEQAEKEECRKNDTLEEERRKVKVKGKYKCVKPW